MCRLCGVCEQDGRRGFELVSDPFSNAGLAFTDESRDAARLRGLLPAAYVPIVSGQGRNTTLVVLTDDAGIDPEPSAWAYDGGVGAQAQQVKTAKAQIDERSTPYEKYLW